MGECTGVIAILDDEAEFRRALARVLSVHGFHSESFETGQALIAAAADRRFHCVLLDLHMPGMSGFDVLAALRVSPAPPPVVVITGHDDPEYCGRALALHAVACLRKPIRTADLLAAIAHARDLPFAST